MKIKSTVLLSVLSLSLVLGVSSILITTIGSESIEYEVHTFGVKLFPLIPDPVTGVPARAANLEFGLQFDYAGMYAPRWTSDFDYGVVFPFINVSLIDAKDVRLSTYTYNSDEGVPILRHTHEVTIWERDDGKNFTVKFIVDAPTADTWTKYVGYKVPMSKTGLKITFEFDNYLSHWNGTDIRLSNPSIFATFKTDIKTDWNSPFDLTNEDTWRMQAFESELSAELLPGYPSLEEYGTYIARQADIEGRSEFRRSEYGLTFRHDIVNFTMSLLGFSSTQYDPKVDNLPGAKPSPDGLGPVDSKWTFWPKRTTTEKLKTWVMTTGPSEISLPFQFYVPLNSSYGYGDKIVWDPELGVMFGKYESQSEPSGESSIAGIAAGSVAAVVVVACAIVGFIVFQRRRSRSIARNSMLNKLEAARASDFNQPSDLQPKSEPAPSSSAPQRVSTWDKSAVEDKKAELRQEL